LNEIPAHPNVPPYVNVHSHARRFAPSSTRRCAWNAFTLVAACLFAFGGCRTPPKPAEAPLLGWRPVASWSGQSNYQTDSFDIGTGQWRIKWETQDQPIEKQKTFRVIVHSSVSGRFVEVAVDHPSAGKGISYVAEDPRAFFLVVESTGVDWKLNVEEGAVAAK
jgi:hypothetical protein